MIVTGCILGRAPRTKETLPDFREWCRVTRHPRVFRRLMGCQRDTPRLELHSRDQAKRPALATSRRDAQHAPTIWVLRVRPSAATSSLHVLCAWQGRLCACKCAQCTRTTNLTQLWVWVTVLVYCSWTLFIQNIYIYI